MTLTQRRASKRKIEILEAALAVLSEDGYSRASMDKIAERALLTRVGLYKHFRDKHSLIAALRQYKLLELTEQVRAALQAAPDFENKLRTVVQETLFYQSQNQGFFRVLLSSSFSSDLSADDSLKPFIYVVAEVFALGLESGLLHPADPLEYAGLLTTLVFEPSIKQAFITLPKDFAPPSHLGELISRVFLQGVLI